jgi:hypothetical protein
LNETDLPEIPAEVKRRVAFKPVENVDEVLKEALEPVRTNRGGDGLNGARRINARRRANRKVLSSARKR